MPFLLCASGGEGPSPGQRVHNALEEPVGPLPTSRCHSVLWGRSWPVAAASLDQRRPWGAGLRATTTLHHLTWGFPDLWCRGLPPRHSRISYQSAFLKGMGSITLCVEKWGAGHSLLVCCRRGTLQGGGDLCWKKWGRRSAAPAAPARLAWPRLSTGPCDTPKPRGATGHSPRAPPQTGVTWGRISYWRVNEHVERSGQPAGPGLFAR